jgi:hypothetical protein
VWNVPESLFPRFIALYKPCSRVHRIDFESELLPIVFKKLSLNKPNPRNLKDRVCPFPRINQCMQARPRKLGKSAPSALQLNLNLPYSCLPFVPCLPTAHRPAPPRMHDWEIAWMHILVAFPRGLLIGEAGKALHERN